MVNDEEGNEVGMQKNDGLFSRTSEATDRGKILMIARLAYEMNREYCRLATNEEHLPWEQAPTWQRATILQGVVFHLRHPHADPLESHENWMVQKLNDGWVHGDVKDFEAKTHPCLVPYHALPIEQQMKDYLFICAVRGAIESGIIGLRPATNSPDVADLLANQDESG